MMRDIKERTRGHHHGGLAGRRRRGARHALAKRIDAQLAIVDKRREQPGESEVMNVIGNVEDAHHPGETTSSDSGGTLRRAPRR